MFQFDSSTGALSLKKIPESIVMIGGGVIGLELVNYLKLINQINFYTNDERVFRALYGADLAQRLHVLNFYRTLVVKVGSHLNLNTPTRICWINLFLNLKGIDMEVSKAFQKILVKQGIQFKLEHKVVAADKSGDKIRVDIESVKNPENKSSVITWNQSFRKYKIKIF